MFKSSLLILIRFVVLAAALIAIGQVLSHVPTDCLQGEQGRWPEADLEPLDQWERNRQHPHPEQPIQRAELVTHKR